MSEWLPSVYKRRTRRCTPLQWAPVCITGEHKNVSAMQSQGFIACIVDLILRSIIINCFYFLKKMIELIYNMTRMHAHQPPANTTKGHETLYNTHTRPVPLRVTPDTAHAVSQNNHCINGERITRQPRPTWHTNRG